MGAVGVQDEWVALAGAFSHQLRVTADQCWLRYIRFTLHFTPTSSSCSALGAPVLRGIQHIASAAEP